MSTELATPEKIPTKRLEVKGMTCANCAAGIKKFLEKQGLEDVSVHFATDEVLFRDKPDIDFGSIQKGIESLGYSVSEPSEQNGKAAGWSRSEIFFLITLPFSLLLLSAMFVPWSWLHNGWVQLGICLPVFMIGLLYFGKSALSSLRTGVPNMDVLITLGSSAAFIYSLVGTINGWGHDFMFYETAATIISLVLLGNVIEHRSVKQTTKAMESLSQLQPQTAKVVTSASGNGSSTIQEIAANAVEINQIIQLNQGDKVPVDGMLTYGAASFDESAITGESTPVFKQKEDAAISGSLVVDGSCRIRATRAYEDSTLSRIIQLVKQAQQDRPPIQRLADRVSAVFVPAVVSIALLTFLLSHFLFGISFTQSLLQSVAVLVISCPCAMGLATPTAVMVGVGRAAGKGILIKGGDTIESLTKVKYAVFDKTGTLTTGAFRVKDSEISDEDSAKVQAIVAELEKHSSHPIAKALHKHWMDRPAVELDDIEEIKGVGMQGNDDNGNTWKVGSSRLAEDNSTHDLHILKNDELIGWIDIEDEIKEEAFAAIRSIRKSGITPVLLSGDRKHKCDRVAEQLGIEEVHAEKLPDEKLAILDEYMTKGKTVMIGDGINDAPALAKAHVGISLSEATDVAIQSARVILLQGNLARLPEALAIAQTTVTTIKQNLFWAFFYNVIAIPIAAVGLLSPMIAAFSMAFSDVVVIGNSVRLKYRNLRLKPR